MDKKTWIWWTGLRLVSVLNLAFLIVTLALAPESPQRFTHLICASLYTLVCGFRSFFPRIDLERAVLIDHPLSSIALGRSCATVAEMAFTVQCAVFAAGLGEAFHWVPAVLIPLIAIAQCCCWAGVLTLNHLWHAAEEVLWGLSMGLLATVFALSLPGEGIYKTLLPLAILGCAAGAFVMLVLDVPMYVKRRRQAIAAGEKTLGLGEGFRDAMKRREPTGDWEFWKHEVAWMTPYFSACVWLSIAALWL